MKKGEGNRELLDCRKMPVRWKRTITGFNHFREGVYERNDFVAVVVSHVPNIQTV